MVESTDYTQPMNLYKPHKSLDETESIKERLWIVDKDLKKIKELDLKIQDNAKKEKLKNLSTELEMVNEDLAKLNVYVYSADVLEEVGALQQKCDELKNTVQEINLTMVSIKPGIEVVTESIPEPIDFIDHLPENVKKVEFKDTPDFTTLGDQNLTLSVLYENGTKTEINVKYKVVEKEWFFQKIWNRWKKIWNKEESKDTATKAAIWWALLVGWGILGSRIEKRREERKVKREARKAEREAKRAERKKKWWKWLLIGWILWALWLWGYHIHKKIKEKEPSKKE